MKVGIFKMDSMNKNKIYGNKSNNKEEASMGMGIGDWGLGIGDWGLGMGIGDWAQSPIPNPQSPIPNPQSPNQEKEYFQVKDIKIYKNKV